ncbi:MAG: ATP-binding protein [Clostridia bacterium]
MHKRHVSNILREYEQKRQNNEQTINDRKLEVYRKVPELAELDRKMRSNATKAAIVAFENDKSVEKAIDVLKKNHKMLNSLKQEALAQNGYPKNYLDPIYDCYDCKDYGYIGTDLCPCIEKACLTLEKREMSSILNISTQSFETFNLDLYSKVPDSRYKMSPNENMVRNYKRLKDYAENFSFTSENLLFIGNPGLSKTFLSTCIAKEVVKKSYSVVYDTCINILNNYESQKFSSYDAGISSKITRYANCDLLIIDDLGTEMVTSFTISALYNLINERIMQKKPMIINTNYVMPELVKKYSPAIASRLDGEFRHVFFFGEDIRKVIKNS